MSEYINDKNLQRELEFTKNWYGRVLPQSLDNGAFTQFALRSKNFAELIAPNAKILVDAIAPTAYTDGEDIYIAGIFFIAKFYKDYGIEDEDITSAAIALVNGLQSHEALHILLSDRLISDSANRVVGILPAEILLSKFFADLMNIVEDVFIENYCVTKFPTASIFVQAQQRILFSQHVRDMVYTYLQTSDKVEDFLEVLTLAKNVDILDDSRFDDFDNLFMILYKAKNSDLTRKDRALIAVELYNEITKNLKNPISEKPTNTPDTKKADKGENYDGDSPDGDVAEKMMSDFCKSIAAKDRAKTQEAFNKMLDNATSPEQQKQIVKMRNEARQAIEEAKRDFAISSYERVETKELKLDGKVIFESSLDMFEKTTPYARESKNVLQGELPEWKGFDRYLRYSREEKHTTGRLRDTGAKMINRQIFRIATDNKIFANRDKSSVKRGKPEIIILIDMSGSMGAYAENIADKNGEPVKLYNHVVRVAYSAYLSLVRAGIACAVYAHSTDGYDDTHVVGIVANKMPLMGKQEITSNDVEKRFNAMKTMQHNSNRDGVALDFVAKRFSSKAGSKIVLVMSDGQPSAANYGGSAGVAHTTSVANKLRKAGKHVMAISLVKGVVEANNQIYGIENNVHAYDGMLSKSIQKVIANLDIH